MTVTCTRPIRLLFFFRPTTQMADVSPDKCIQLIEQYEPSAEARSKHHLILDGKLTGRLWCPHRTPQSLGDCNRTPPLQLDTERNVTWNTGKYCVT